jgi:hypothetical protein
VRLPAFFGVARGLSFEDVFAFAEGFLAAVVFLVLFLSLTLFLAFLTGILPRFFATFFVGRTREEARTFFVFRFTVFFLGVATTKSFAKQDYPDWYSTERLARRLRKHSKHRENQRFSFEIVFGGVPRGAADLFPHLCQPCKARQVGIGIAGTQALAHPAIDAVDEGRECDPVVAAQRLSQGMKLAWINLRQGGEHGGSPLVKFHSVATKQRKRARDTPLRGFSSFRQRGVVDCKVCGVRCGLDDVRGGEWP